jgi:hypothetical protein
MSSKEKSWKEIPPAGVCWKSSKTYLTGDWKTYQPVRDIEKYFVQMGRSSGNPKKAT